MIGSLKGRLIQKRPDDIVVEAAGGVGYQVTVGLKTLSELPSEGAEVFLYVYTHVREDAIQLFGFSSEDDKKVFTTLLGISGVGPRVALNIVSTIPHEQFLAAVEAEDIAMLTRVPGLGKKTAHRLVLELRGKLPSREEARERVVDEAFSALVNLGYKKADALKSVEAAFKEGHKDLEALIKESLSKLTKGSDGKGRR